jgi:hypothetical protein
MSLGRGLNPAQVEYDSDVLFHSFEITVPLVRGYSLQSSITGVAECEMQNGLVV